MAPSPPRAYRAAVGVAAAAAACGLAAHRWHIAIYRKRLSEGVVRSPGLGLRPAHERIAAASASAGSATSAGSGSVKRDDIPKLDRVFLRNLFHFLRVAIPGLRTREFATVVAVACLLGVRSWLDLWASANGGKVVKAIVGRDRNAFVRTAVIDIGCMMFPMALVNNTLKYMLQRLSVLMRRRLSHYFHDKYLARNTFYKVSNLDSRIRNVDQLLTVDIERFCKSLADLYSNLTKPSIDIVLFSRRLARSLGSQGPMLMIAYFGICSALLNLVQPPFGQLAADGARLEGEYRLHHSRLIAHSEEIAFFGGAQREKLYINHALDNVVAHARKLFRARWRIGVFDNILVKYVATIVGYLVVAIPVFFADSNLYRLLSPRLILRRIAARASGAAAALDEKAAGDENEVSSASNIAGLYTRNSRLLLQLAGAIGRLVLAGKEINRLTGYCQRVATLRDVLDDLAQDNAVRRRFESSPDLQRDMRLASLMRPGKIEVRADNDIGGIEFAGVNLVSPDATVLAAGLDFAIERGQHVLVTGSNGCGKSSLFRVLAGLWPVYGGVVRSPARSRIFFVPQRPYLALGSLRENVVFPFSWREAVARKGATDESIIEMLRIAHLGTLVERPGGIEAVHDWAEVLSGGQKQRLAFARLLFHRPDFAILDEASSAVSVDIEALLYEKVKLAGITLISVSHRPSLWPFHDKVLKFDGAGSYEYRDIRPDDIPSMLPPSTGAAASSSSRAE